MRIINLHYSYPDGPAALEDVNLDIPDGSLICAAGANGSGKSTLLTLMAGLLSPSSGRIEFETVLSPGNEAGLRERTALVLQDADLQILGATVREDLDMGLDKNGRQLAETFAMRLGLGELMERPVQTLSWGQKRKLTLVSALARNPKLLLLDEPFSGLDYPGALEMRSILAANRKEGMTQVIAAHDLDPLSGIADAAFVLHNGRVTLEGALEEIDSVAERYGVKPPGGSWPEAE